MVEDLAVAAAERRALEDAVPIEGRARADQDRLSKIDSRINRLRSGLMLTPGSQVRAGLGPNRAQRRRMARAAQVERDPRWWEAVMSDREHHRRLAELEHRQANHEAAAALCDEAAVDRRLATVKRLPRNLTGDPAEDPDADEIAPADTAGDDQPEESDQGVHP